MSGLFVFWEGVEKYCRHRELEPKDFNAVSKSLVNKGGYGKTNLSCYDFNWGPVRATTRNDTFYAAFGVTGSATVHRWRMGNNK